MYCGYFLRQLNQQEKIMKIKIQILLLVVLTGMIMGVSALMSKKASATAMVTEATWPAVLMPPPGCSVPSIAYPTIQSAASDASCTTINVAAGVYNENV